MQGWTGWLTRHIASALFYLEAATRIHGKLARTQVNCSRIVPTCVNEVPYARAKDIDFLSLKRSGQRKARPENWGSTTAASLEP